MPITLVIISRLVSYEVFAVDGWAKAEEGEAAANMRTQLSSTSAMHALRWLLQFIELFFQTIAG